MHIQLYSDLENRIKSELLSTACKALFDLTSGTTVYRQAAILDSLYLFIFNSYSKNFSHLQFPRPTEPSPFSAYWNCTCPSTTAEKPFNTYLPTNPLFPLNTHHFLFPSFTSLCFAHSECDMYLPHYSGSFSRAGVQGFWLYKPDRTWHLVCASRWNQTEHEVILVGQRPKSEALTHCFSNSGSQPNESWK